jgi:hypothetical protein
VRGWWEKSPHIVIENMGLSTINIWKCESQLAWIKGNSYGKRRQFLQLGKGRESEFLVLELEGSHSGHVR